MEKMTGISWLGHAVCAAVVGFVFSSPARVRTWQTPQAVAKTETHGTTRRGWMGFRLRRVVLRYALAGHCGTNQAKRR